MFKKMLFFAGFMSVLSIVYLVYSQIRFLATQNCYLVGKYPVLGDRTNVIHLINDTKIYATEYAGTAIFDVICPISSSKFINAGSFIGVVGRSIHLEFFSEIIFFETLTKARQNLIDRVFKNLKEPYSNLLVGIVFGYEGSYPDYYYRLLQSSGMMHLFVASGSNILLVVTFIENLLLRTSYKIKLFIGIFTVTLYVLFVGFEIPILRAYLTYLFTAYFRLKGEYFTSFINTTLVMILFVVINQNLINDISFQLSFIATYSVVMATNLIAKMQVKSVMLSQLIFNILVFIFMMPIIIYYFGQINLLSVVFNFYINYIIAYCFIAGAVSLMWPFDNIYWLLPTIYYPINLIVNLNTFDLVQEYFIFRLKIEAAWVFLLYFFLMCGYLSLIIFHKNYYADFKTNST